MASRFPRCPLPTIGQRLKHEGGFELERTSEAVFIIDSVGNRFTFPCRRELPPPLVRCSAPQDYYGNSISYDFDDEGRLIKLIDSFSRKIFFSHDSLSRLCEVWTPMSGSTSKRWHLVRYEYDKHDDLVAVLDPKGNATRYEYSSHLLTRVTDRCGRDLFYQYDREKKCVRTWFTGGVWDRQLRYDRKTSRVLVTDPYGQSMLYKHNGKGVVIGDVDALGRSREDVVDDSGRLLLRIRGRRRNAKRDQS